MFPKIKRICHSLYYSILKNNYLDMANQQSIYLYKTRYGNYYKEYAMAVRKNMRFISNIYIIIKQLFFNTKAGSIRCGYMP